MIYNLLATYNKIPFSRLTQFKNKKDIAMYTKDLELHGFTNIRIIKA